MKYASAPVPLVTSKLQSINFNVHRLLSMIYAMAFAKGKKADRTNEDLFFVIPRGPLFTFQTFGKLKELLQRLSFF